MGKVQVEYPNKIKNNGARDGKERKKTNQMEEGLKMHESKIKVRDGSRRKYLPMSEFGMKLLYIVGGVKNAVRISQIFGPDLLLRAGTGRSHEREWRNQKEKRREMERGDT